MLKLYLNVCCLNRLFDDKRQERVRLETEAVTLILNAVESGRWEWISSAAVRYETEKNPFPERLADVRLTLRLASRSVPVTKTEKRRAAILHEFGFGALDSLHVACAETASADVFLTTDDRLLRVGIRNMARIRIRIENPLTWIQEKIH